jgi:hypothetical protein
MNEPTPISQSWPNLRLDFYDTAVIMTQWKNDGQLLAYPVSIDDIVSACSNVTLGSSLLPANTLFWQQQADQMALGIYVPARRWRVQTEGRSYHVPMPPFVFVGNGTSYSIYAVKKRPSNLSRAQPRGEHDHLYHVPCPNVHTHGGICQGNTPFPHCSPQNILTALTLFMEGSLFNADLSRGKCVSRPEDVRELWAQLDGRKRFPQSELVPTQLNLQGLLF